MEDLLNRISVLERGVGKLYQAPTLPVYDMISVPPPPPPPQPDLLAVMTSDGSSGGYTHDDYTPALYYMFPTSVTEAWVRATFRHDLVQGFPQWPYAVLGFTEWVNDQAYYGDWWRTGGWACYTENNAARADFTRWNFSGGISGFGYYNQLGASPSIPTVSTTYDYFAQFQGIQFFGAPYNRNAAKWFIQAYKNGVQRTELLAAFYPDTGKPAYSGLQAIVFFNQYGNTGAHVQSDTHGYLFIDDISVGTSMGASDILYEDFSSGGFGHFNLDLGDMSSMTESYHINTDPPIFPRPTF